VGDERIGLAVWLGVQKFSINIGRITRTV